MANDDKVISLDRPTDWPASRSDKLQFDASAYTTWVVEKLKARYGPGRASVVRYIVRDWIREHDDELREMGISIKLQEGELRIFGDDSEG